MASSRESSRRIVARSATAALASAMGVLALLAAPALGAPPETPETTSPAKSVTATSATLEGVLNPGSAGTPGSYQFSYAQSESGECSPGSFAPESPALATGALREKESVGVTGLEPDEEYAFCIVAYSLSAEASYGGPVSFKTLPAKPTVVSESAAVTSSTATLEAQLNPNNEETKYVFEYASKEKAGVLEAPITKVTGTAALSGFGEQTASIPAIEGLAPGKSYFYRVAAKNATGVSNGAVKELATVPTPQTEAVTAATATTATFHGTLTPLNATVGTEYSFEYDVSAEPQCTGEAGTPPVSAGTGSGSKAVSSAVTELQPSATYTVCLVSTNAFGSEADPSPTTFKTLAAPPKVDSEGTSGATPFEATLEAQLNPDNQETTYTFEYATNSALTGATVLDGAAPLAGYGDQTASAGTGHVLTPGTTYYYRVTAENAAHETTEGAIEELTTPSAVAPTIEGETSSGISAEDATLEATVNPNFQEATCDFEYAGSESAIGTAGATSEPCTAALGSGGGGVATSIAVTGLRPATSYYFRIVASNGSGAERGQIETFETLAASPPTVISGSEAVSAVEETQATLEAEIVPGGAQTTYHFEYGPTSSYDESTPQSAPIGADESEHAVEATVTGLTPGTTYHYRVVATNVESPGGTPGPDAVFTTPEVASTGADTCANAARRAEQSFGRELPDCRAYEMVSPAETNGQDATDTYIQSPARASEQNPGEEDSEAAIAYASRGAFGSPSGANAESYVLSRREAGAGRWSTRAISPLFEPDLTEEVKAFSTLAFTPNLTTGIAVSNAALTPEAPKTENSGGYREDDLYLSAFAPGAEQSYRYVGDGHVPMGTSTDLGHVVFGEEGGVYEWVDGETWPVSVENDGEAVSASVGDAALESSGSFAIQKDTWHAVSANGLRVFFTSPAYGSGQLFLRTNPEQLQSPMSGEHCTVAADACTTEVSASQRGTPDSHGPQPARFWGASTDGARVFFTSTAELTNDAYTGPEDNAANLYEYDVEDEKLTDLTVDAGDVEEGAAVQGVSQISEHGSYVYFVAKGVLAEGENAAGEEATEGAENLYVSHEGATTFVAALAANDSSVWSRASFPEYRAGPAVASAVVSPSGERFGFMSERSLTGYDNVQSRSGQCEGEIAETGEQGTENCREVYLYDAATHSLVCASCDPSGARPVGPSSLRQLPVEAQAEYRPHNLLEDGALFFDSSDALVPDASNGRRNVFEYSQGHTYAISDVTGGHESFFIDASPSGSDVFFATADDLVPQDTGDNIVVYDARVEGGFPMPAGPAGCSNESSCRPAPPSQPDWSEPSTGLSGSGNVAPLVTTTTVKKKTAAQLKAEKLAKALKACRKDKVKKKRVSCERKARVKYGKARKAKKANDERRASR